MICDEQDFTFYLGTHRPTWLYTAPPDVALFPSHSVLSDRKTPFPRAPFRRHYAVDSGAFTELKDHGRFRTSDEEYIEALARYDEEIGDLAWAAPQDWMCEPPVIQGGWWDGQHFVGTGLSVEEHQQRTVANFVRLEELWPSYGYGDCPVMPVIQGWAVDDYVRCVEMYQDAGVRLAQDYPVVGVGSVCRRQGTKEAGEIFRVLAQGDLPLHGFGVKTDGLKRFGRWLTTADSMAWSAGARKRKILLPECVGKGHKNCANCMTYALQWRDRLLSGLDPDERDGQQLDLLTDLEAA